MSPALTRPFKDDSASTKQLFRYGIGVVAGMAVAQWAERMVRKIPIVGTAIAPILGLIPTSLVGGALGAAVVYGIDEGDLQAARKKLIPRVRRRLARARHEMQSIVDDLSSDLQRAHHQNERAARNLLPSLEDAVDDMGRQLAPAFERQYRMGKRQLEQSFPDLQLPEPVSSQPRWY